ncbi:MAG: sugar ABC transporter ATP-binding protein [Acetobacteraceae bacterium]|nr:sugar ABC transporter ATP-binding protein [Acetobacteraceae bacterium]
MSSAPAAIEVRDVRKAYGRTVALDGLTFSVGRGEIHGLLGENGAGKSTLIRLLSGLARPDSGTIRIAGRDAPIAHPSDAHARGIRTAFQEISLIPDLTVAQNFFLSEEPRNRLGFIGRGALERRAEQALAELGLHDIDPGRQVRELDLSTRQKIEIARAMSRGGAHVLLLDEPTSALAAKDVQWLASLILRRKAARVSVLFISHRLQEVRELCDAVTIMRNGRSAGTFATGEMSDARIVELMIGRSLAATFPPKPLAPSTAPPLLSVRGLSTPSGLRGIDLDMRPGEILGVAALEGMGQRDLFLALFGLVERASGEIRLRGEPADIGSAGQAVAAGIGLVPEDRKTEGLLLDLDVRENATLPSLARFARGGLIDTAAEGEAALAAVEATRLQPLSLAAAAGSFSGGNQQKIALAKWLVAGSRILLLYDPTRGIDVGTKAEIYGLMRRFADEGGTILFYSTDIPELVHLCNEVVVLYRGEIRAALRLEQVREAAILRAMLGQAAATWRNGDGYGDG